MGPGLRSGTLRFESPQLAARAMLSHMTRSSEGAAPLAPSLCEYMAPHLAALLWHCHDSDGLVLEFVLSPERVFDMPAGSLRFLRAPHAMARPLEVLIPHSLPPRAVSGCGLEVFGVSSSVLTG